MKDIKNYTAKNWLPLYAAVSHLSRVLTQPATFIPWTGVGVCLRVPIASTNINQLLRQWKSCITLRHVGCTLCYLGPSQLLIFKISSTTNVLHCENLRQALNQPFSTGPWKSVLWYMLIYAYIQIILHLGTCPSHLIYQTVHLNVHRNWYAPNSPTADPSVRTV
jgi:hypothetical protein